MGKLDELKALTEEIIHSYELRIATVGEMIDNTYQLLDELRDKRVTSTAELRDALAVIGSVRKKDFDEMMREVLRQQDRQEKHIRDLLKTYIKEQEDAAHAIREKFHCCNLDGQEENGTNPDDFRNLLNQMQCRQCNREKEIITLLNDFREKNRETVGLLQNVYHRKDTIRVRALKQLLQNIYAGKTAAATAPSMVPITGI